MSEPYPPQPMRHSAAYYQHQRASNNSSPSHHYPHPPHIQRPPAVYASQGRPSPAGRYQPQNTYVKTSVSSATSGSSAASDLKPYQPTQSYNMGSQAERGLIHGSSRRTSHISPTQSHRHHGSNVGQSEMVEDHSAVIRYLQEHEIEDQQPAPKDHAIWVLVSLALNLLNVLCTFLTTLQFWLSFLDPAHSLFSCLFTIIVVIGLVILTPLRMCQKEASFSTSLIRTVAPVFRHHLQMIYAPSVKNAHTFDFSPSALVFVHFFSPILSVGVAFFSWIAAVFWLFALIMGNPDGTEKRDDGRATVIGVRNWWEKYFLNAIRR